jgi:GNAT superfamily N-acetyltransferase
MGTAVETQASAPRTPRTREATLEDASSLAGLMTTLGYPTSSEQMEGRLWSLLANPEYQTIVAVSAEHVIGMVGVHHARGYEFDGPYARIVALSVLPDEVGAGVGRALVDAAEEAARARAAVMLIVSSSSYRESAHRFYEARGFVQTGIRLVKQLDDLQHD